MPHRKLSAFVLLVCYLGWCFYWFAPFFQPLLAHPPQKLTPWFTAFFQGYDQRLAPLWMGTLVSLGVLLVMAGIGLRLSKHTTNYGSAHRARRREASPFVHHRPLLRLSLFHPSLRDSVPYERRRAERDPYFLLGRSHHQPITLTQKQIESNVVLTAPIGAGKTSRVIVPNLLREQGHRSLFIPDVKKELVRLTAGYLSQCYEIQVFDPTDPGNSIGYNPLAHIRTYDDCQEFAACWVANTGQGKEDFWPNAAKMLLAATLMHLHVAEPTAPFSRVADILCTSSFEHMKDVLQHSLAREVRNGTNSLFEYLTLNSKLIGSLMTDIATRFELLKSETVRHVTTSNQVSFEQMPQRPIALFLSIPRRSAQRFQPLSACFLLQMFTAWEQYAEQTPAGRLPRGITCYMDEFPNLGYIPNFSGIISTARHTGVGLVLIMQSFNQLDEKYGVSVRKTILTNCMTHLLLPGAGQEECEYYSDRVGRTTVQTTSYSEKATGIWFKENSTTQSETGRPLFTPDELRTMHEDTMFLLYATAAPLLLDTLPYFKDRAVAYRATMPRTTTKGTEEETQPASANPPTIPLLPPPKPAKPQQSQGDDWLA
jgi:type IV secretion system protein VirD4